MREIRLVHNRPQHNVQILQSARDPYLGATSKSTYRLTSSSDTFRWTPSLTDEMMQFLRFLKDNCKSLVVRLHGFSQDDENMMMWFQQACQWDLIAGIVANNLRSQTLFIYYAITSQCVSPWRFLKIHLYPADFNSPDAHSILAGALQQSNCLNQLELQLLSAGFSGGLDAMTRTLSQGIGKNRSIRNLILSGWDEKAWSYFFGDLADRGESFDQLILEKAGYASYSERNPMEWCCTLNMAKHIGFVSCKNSATTIQCLQHLDSFVLSHLQLTNAGWTSQQVDDFLVQFTQSCSNLSTLDLRSNKIDDLAFPRFFALVDSDTALPSVDSGTAAPSTPHLRPLWSLTSFLLDGNPVLSENRIKRNKLGPNLYCLFRRIPSLNTILQAEETSNKTKIREREKLERLTQFVRVLVVESHHLGFRLSPVSWPLLLSTANRILQSEPSLQAQAIYEFLLHASAVLSNEAAVEPTATTSDKSAGNEALWLSFQKLLPWY